MPVSSTTAFPTVESVLNLARVYLNDTQNNGAGRVFTDSQPFILPLLNSAQAYISRRLNVGGARSLIRDDCQLFGVPVINSSLGQGVPNTAAYQKLSFTGFFDGLLNYQNPVLPYDCLQPIVIRQRQTDSGLPFTEMTIAQEGLPSIYQTYSLGQWEWRQNAIYWNGSINQMDVWIRYIALTTFQPGSLPPSSFPTTQIPISDGTEALAYRMAFEFSNIGRGGQDQQMPAALKEIIDDLINRYVRGQQNRVYVRQGFGGDYDDWDGGAGGYGTGGWW